MKGLHKALLGRPAINSLNIIQQIQPVHALNAFSQFPELFTGLGRLKDNYTIKLTDDAKPFALITPRRVVVPLLPKVKAELDRMEKIAVISKVTTLCRNQVE